MPIYRPQPIEKEDFDTVHPLGTDRKIFNELEVKWRNLRAMRTMIVMPLTVLGSIGPFVYVAIWPLLQDMRLDRNAEWWMWQALAVVMGAIWLWISWFPYNKIHALEEKYNESLDALDAKDYFNEFLVELSTGRRLSTLNNLSPLSDSDLSLYAEKVRKTGPKTSLMWETWMKEDAPIRICDLFTVEKMILKEQWSGKEK